MKKRILSLVLAIAMCFSVVSVFAANDEAVLMGEIGDLIDQYKDRVWEWQENQFGAMTGDQAAAIEAAWTSYEAKKDEVKAIAEQLATDYATDEYIELGLADTANGKDGTLKNLYKWKLMRDIMEDRIDVTSDDADYIDWLARFTAFEEENDERVSPAAPTAALGNLKHYSAELTEFFGELAVLVNNGLVLEGADADKANLYVEAFNDEQADADYSNEDEFYASLKADIIELATEGMFNAFDLGMQVATNQINKENTPGLFEMIPDRDMKAAFLILGEEFVRYVVDFIPEVKADLLKMNKNDFVPVVMPSVAPLLGGNNTATVEAMYNTVAAVADFIAQQDFCEDAVGKVDAYYAADVADGIVDVKDALNEAMTLIDANHAIELIHYNTFMGRELLRYDNEGEWTKLNGAELDGDALTSIVLGFAHDRYPVVENNLNLNPNVASFDANYDADGFKVYAHEDNIGELVFEVAEDADGEATVVVYRGYTDEDLDGVADNDEDVYRYVATFTLAATAAEAPYVELDDVADTTVDGVITVKGETNLDYVTVAITKPVAGVVKTVYAVVYSKAEFEAGIAIEAPDAAVVGEVYTVVVGTEKASDSDDFTIIDDAADYYVNLDDVADTTADGTITVKGETNLDYVTVAITKPVAGGVKTIYAVVYSKAEFEAGIAIEAPDAAVVGEVYTVVVGTEKASDSDDFTIIDDAVDYYVNLDDVADTTVDGVITVKGETNLDYVTVAITKPVAGVVKTVYAVVYSKAEFEAGIAIEAPDAAVVGEVYTVVVGTEKASDSDDFTIIDDAVDYYVNLDDVADTTADGTITVKGETNLDYVTVAITKPVAGVVKTVYAVVYSKAEFEAGITINAPDGAVVGEVYTVVVGTEKASDSDEFEIKGDDAPYVDLDEVVNPVVKEDGSTKVVIKGETNLDEVKVTIKDEDGNVVYEDTHTKDELENGIEAEIDGVEPGDNFTVEVTEPGKSDVLDTDEFVAPSLALVGSATRTISKGQSRDIQTTPQGVPAGATAEVVWTLEDGTIIEVTKTSGDAKNFATVKGLKKGTTTLTATLYIDGAATNAAVTVTVKVTTGGGGGGGKVYTNITVKVDETKDVVKVPTGGVNVEFDGTGDGEVKVEIVDGKVVVTGVKEGEVKGTVKVTDENGRTVLTGDYKFTVTEGDAVVKEHECEWPDIAAGWEGKAAPHWAHETIDIMTINGYINGYPDGMFKPDQNITRAEFTAIVYRILGLEIAEDGVLYDDTVGHWAEDIIATMSLPEGYGMTRGYGDGNFGPNDMITREQAVAIIARAKSAVWVEAEEGAKDIFTDAEDISWWFDGEMDAAVANGLITGYEDGSYKPLNFTTRAEACILLARAWPEVLELD